MRIIDLSRYKPFRLFMLLAFSQLLLSCTKDREKPNLNWEEVDLGRGNVDVQYLRRTDNGLLISTPGYYIRLGKDFQDGAWRVGYGGDVDPFSNSILIVDFIDLQTFSIFGFVPESYTPKFFKTPKIDNNPLEIVASFPMVRSSRVATPFAMSPHNEDTDTTHLFYFGINSSGYFLVDQPIFVPPFPYDTSKGPYLDMGPPKLINVSQLGFNSYTGITYHKGYIYLSINQRIDIKTGIAERFDNNDIDYLELASPANDTLFGLTYVAGSISSMVLLKVNSQEAWDTGFKISRPGNVEAIGKVGRYMAIGFNSQPVFIDIETKKAKVLALGNLPKNRVMSSIAAFNGYVYIGYRSGGLFKKPMSEIEAELSRIR